MKYSGLALLSVLCTAAAWGQRDEGASLGVRAGVILPVLDFDHVKTEGLPGVSVGLFSKAPVAGNFYIQPELSGCMERVRVSEEGTGNGQLQLTLHYAECTFLAVYNLSDRFAVHAGPFAGYFVYLRESGSWRLAQDSGFFKRDDFHDANVGMIYGVAAEFSRYDIGFRFNHGMFIIGSDTQSDGYAGILRTKNAYLQLYGTYLF